MKNGLLVLLLFCILADAKLLTAQQITAGPAERKMSTMLIKKFRQQQNDAAIKKISPSEYKNRYNSKFTQVDINGRIFLSITAVRNIDVVANTITSWGGEIHNLGTLTLYAWVPLDKLNDLSALDGVTFIDVPGHSYTKTGSVTSAGDHQLLADSTRSMFYTNGADINGNPIRVGVISDGMQYWSNSRLSGDLPYIGWINNSNNFVGSEGTAMMEIIHDLAPSADLTFGAVGFYVNSNNDSIYSTPIDMANAISTLSSSSGCKVIVDDMGWPSGDPWFEDGVISQAISNFQSNGGTYISSAGNDGNKMYSGQPSIKVGGRKNWVFFTATDSALTFTISDYKTFRIAMQWDDAWGNASDDYNLYLYDNNWNLVDSSTNYQAGSGSLPQEWIGLTYSNYLDNRTFHIMVDYVGYYTGKPLKNIKVLVLPVNGNSNGSPSFTLTNGSSSGHIYGHAAATNVISVAAYSALDQTPSVETFSSRGPSLMFTTGNPANEQSRNTPVITATDGVVTKVGKDGNFGGDSLFFGTSASAPHVAAIAALYFSRYPTHTSAQFTSAITSSAKYISTGTGGTWNSTSGYGKISAYDAIVKGLTTLNNPQVTSNTTWDLNRITGTANISAGKSVTIDANYTTLVEGTINLGDANSKILVYGTLILSSTASVNPASGLITEPGGRIVSPNMVNVSVTQLDESSTPFGTVGHWTFNRFDSAAVPYVFPSFNNTPERMRGQQYFKTGTTQKFQLWNGSNTRVVNPDTFKTTTYGSHAITSQFKTANNATLQASLEGVTPGGTLNFLDPWMIDTTDTYGQRNQGMADWYRPVSYSSNNLGTGTSHLGILLNRNVADSVYYSVRAPLTQTLNGVTGYFQNWSSGTNFTLQQVGNNPSGYDQKAVIFNNANAVVTANYKGVHLSGTSWLGYWNSTSQKKVVMTSDGYLHMVYGSIERVWYEKSTNNGTTWQLMNNGKPLSSNNSYDPSISANGTEVVIVYQEIVGTGNNIMLFHPCGCGTEGNYLLEAEPVNEGRMTPVVALGANNEVMIVWKRTILSGSKNEGLYYKFGHISYDYHFWYSAGNLADMIDPLGNEVNGGSWNPTIEVTKSVTYPARNVFHIAWQQPSGSYSLIYYTKIDVGTNNSLSSTIGVEDVSSGSGYPYNYAPSISLSTTNVVNVVWAAMPYWYSSPRKVFSRTRTTGWSSYFGQYGNSVNSPSVAFYGSSSVIAWSETNGSGYSDKFYKWGSVRTANTTGRDLQIYSTTTLQDMRIVSHSRETLPYSFAQSSDLYNLNKENPLAMCSGVQVVAAQEKTEFYFRIGDISLNGKNVAFKDMNLNAINLSQSDLDYLMTSDVVTLGDADNLGYSIEYGATDTVKALSLLQNNKFISFNVELVDASNDALLYTLNDVKLNGNSSLGLSSESYNIDLSGLSGKQVYFKVKITNNLKPVYYASEIKSDAKVLAKSKTVSLNLSKSIVVKEYDLFQNYPNPFNPVTTINYQLPKSGSVTLKIFDILGNEVMTLVNEQKEMGRYTVQFDASSLASGMYVYQLRVNDYTSTKKMMLLK